MSIKAIPMLLATFLLIACSSKELPKPLAIKDLSDSLKVAGLKVEDCREKMFQMVMAVDGCGLTVDGKGFEVYQFDLSIESGKKALETWQKEGLMGQPVLVHNNLMAVVSQDHPSREKILKTFNGL